MLENRLQRRHPLVQFILDNGFYLLIAVLMWRLPHLLGDYFDQPIDPRRVQGNQPVYWMGVFANLYILAILAMSYNLVFGFAGILSFGHALFFGIGVYVLVILMGEFLVSFVVSWAVAIAVAALFGIFVGLAAFRIKGVYFAMFTLALAQIVHELARVNLFKFLTEGDDGRSLEGLPDWINPVGERLRFYYICAFLAALTFVIIRRLMNSPSGKVILAIRDNEERAQTMGYNTVLYKLLVIVMASILAVQAGLLHATFTRQAEPGSLSLTRTVDPLLMTIIGGTGTNPGPVVGAAILHLGETFFRKPDLQVDLNFILFDVEATVNTTEIWRMILGVVFILIVLLIPYGVVGQINEIWLHIRQFFRRFVYNRLVLAYPKLATYAEPLTGEPPELALAMAEQTRDLPLLGWAREHPYLAAGMVIFAVALMGGIVLRDIQVFFSLVLFCLLLLVPILVGNELYGRIMARAK